MTKQSNSSTQNDLPIFTTSERRTFKRCEWRWWMAYREGLAVPTPSAALWMGIGIHDALATYYRRGRKRAPKLALDRWAAYCDEDPMSIDYIKSAEGEWHAARELGLDMLRRYHDHWGGDPDWDVIDTEHPFRIEIPTRHGLFGTTEGIFASTFDGVYRDRRDGKIKLMEHKTAKAINLLHLEGDEQGSVYYAVATHVLQDEGILSARESLSGVTYNILRKAIPNDTRARNREGLYLNKNGSISKIQPPPFFAREFVTRRRAEVTHIFRQLSTDFMRVNEMRNRHGDLTKNHTNDCHWDCSFYNMCLLHDQGVRDWTDLRDSIYVVRDPYRAAYRKAA